MQTDVGDTRLNNYFLEHSFQWLTNPDYSGSLWSPSFFYPADEVLAYSDNLFGSAPIYWLIRFLASPPTAFQIWMIAVSVLNFFSFFYLSKYVKIGTFLSSLGAFLFAFGLPRIVKLGHQQLLPQFFTPLVILAALNFIKKPSRKWFIALLTGCYLQVLAGIYLGWFLLLSLPIFFLLSYRLSSESFFRFLKFWKSNKVFLFSSILGWIVLTALTLLPYLKRSVVHGGRTYQEVDTMLPRVASWFSVPPHSVLSPLLSKVSSELPMVHEHYMFLGFIVFFLFLGCTFSLLKGGKNLYPDERWLIKVCFFTFACIFLLSLRFPSGLSLWRIVYEVVPGASAIRAVTRIWTVAYCYFLLAVLLWANAFFRNAFSDSRKRLFAIFIVCLLSISEQATLNQPSFDKATVSEEVTSIERLIGSGCDLAYLSINPEKPFYSEQLSAVWAGINTNVPIINGYSGDMPLNYGDIFQAMTTAEVIDWLNVSDVPDNSRLCMVGEASVLSADDLLQSSAKLSTKSGSGNLSVYRVQLPLER